MACKYFYKGHEFANELALDDFLIEQQQYESILGDIVFSTTPILNSINIVLNRVQNDAKQLYDAYLEARKKGLLEYGEDGEISYAKPPFIGVNKFLSGLKNSSGELLFPEFREQEYWSRRFEAWGNGEFSESEIEEFGLNKSNLVPIKKLQIGNTSNYERMRDQMKNKWRIQAETGTAIHNVLQLVFSKTDGEYNFNLPDLKEIVSKNIEEKNKKYLTPEIIDQAIDYALKIHKDLVHKFGEDAMFFPEFTMTQNTNRLEPDGSPTKLYGIIDLLIVDSKGHAHILDYKTSVHRYAEFNDAKKLAYSYQMGVYQRMLENHGISSYQGELMVAPIHLSNFRKEGDTYIYDGIETPDGILPTSHNTPKMWDNIDEFLPSSFEITVAGEHIGENVSTWMANCFPSYSAMRGTDEEATIKFLEKAKLLEPNENGILTFRKANKEGLITSDSESDFVKKVTEYFKKQPSRRLKYTGEVKTFILKAIKEGIDNVDMPKPGDAKLNRDSDDQWLRSTLAKYADGNWEVVDRPELEAYGIIMLKTINASNIPELIDFVRVSTSNLHLHYRKYLEKDDIFKNRKGLTSKFESDVQAFSKGNTMMAEAVNGNVELMETMAIINQISGLENRVVGNVSVVSPLYANGVSMSNEQLLYCFNELTKFSPIPNNKIMDGRIRFASKYELVIQEAIRIVEAGTRKEWKDEYRHFKGFKSAIPNYDSAINGDVEELIHNLLNLLKEIVAHNDRLDGVRIKQKELAKVPVSIYNNILIAIAQLKGINFRQQLKDHSKLLESKFIHLHGLSGSYFDNPGNLDSETLNLITKLVTEAYQNTRDELLSKKIEINKLVKAVKDEAGFSRLSELTIGNQVELYKDMYEVSADGNFLFKNPNRLQGAKKALLEYALNEINSRRFPDKSKEELARMKESNDTEYYEVPLALGGSDSVVSTQGLLSLLRAKLSYLNPKTAFERALKKVQGIYLDLYDSEEDTQTKSEVLFRMSNMFDQGQKDTRLLKISDEGILNLEHNLETLLLKHAFAYSVLKNMDAVFPTIKAAMIHITSLGAMGNTVFSNDISYLEDYIKNKIQNKSIVDEKYQDFVNVANQIKRAASLTTLAFSPVQALYQPLQGLWQDISLMIRKPDGKESFTFNHFKTALKTVYGDLSHFSEKPTLCQLVNESYGINDMDMNTYVDRISSAKSGIWNFENLAYKFASRPDYYNRMAIFLCQMMGDGCFEAHHVDSEGRLIYDWKKDKRFAAFANNDKSNIEAYNKAKSLYYTIAQQFVNEHTKNADGTLFELNMTSPMPLPRAYTNKEAESMKSLADDIYGYYSHEKKSLVMSTALGSLWLQFKTYWSGKKNQYLAPGGVKLRGQWKHYTENGKKYYYQVDANGNILYNKPPTTTPTAAPVYRWEGQWQEGIMLTLCDLAKTMYDRRSFIEGFKEKWNTEDINLRNTYRSNIKQALYDLVMFALIGSIIGALLGDWLDDLKKENKKNRDFSVGLGIAAANIAVMSVKNSFLDLNFIESIGSPIGQWTPFAFEWGGRTLKNWWNVAIGDEDFWDGVVKTSSSLKQIKPALDAIKPDMFRTEREGGTFGKK